MKKKFKILLSAVLVLILISCDENGSINQQLVTSLDRLFDAEIGNRERFSFTFSAPGTFQYTSRKRPDMDGLIIVE